LDGNEEYFT